MTDKQKKIYRIIIISLAVLLVGEIIFFGVKIYKNRKDSTFYSVASSLVLDDNDNSEKEEFLKNVINLIKDMKKQLFLRLKMEKL